MIEPYKTDLLKFLTVVGVLGTVFTTSSLGEKQEKKRNEEELKTATVISRKILGDDMYNQAITRLLLDMDGNTNTVEATCDLKMNLPYSDPTYTKVFPNGTTRTIFELKKMGRVIMKKNERSL